MNCICIDQLHTVRADTSACMKGRVHGVEGICLTTWYIQARDSFYMMTFLRSLWIEISSVKRPFVFLLQSANSKSALCSGPLQRASTACVQRSHGWLNSAQPAWSTYTSVVSCWPSWRSWRRTTGSWRCSTTRWEGKDDGFIAGSGLAPIVFYSQHKHSIGNRCFPLASLVSETLMGELNPKHCQFHHEAGRPGTEKPVQM